MKIDSQKLKREGEIQGNTKEEELRDALNLLQSKRHEKS